MCPGKVLLDAENPRLTTEERGGSQETIRQVMLRRFKIDELGASIAMSGYIDLDPLIGYEKDGQVVVREGNRRIAALQLLLDPSLAPDKYRPRWEALRKELGTAGLKSIEEVRMLLYAGPDDASLESYIGFRHVNGILEWPAAEKARFIVEMVDRHGWSYEEIAERIGSYAKHVERHYIATRLMDQADSSGVDGADQIRVGVLLRALQAGGISDYLGIKYTGKPISARKPVKCSEEDFAFFVRGTFGTEELDPILPESRQITKWGRILQSSEAIRYLKSSRHPNFERAWIKSGGEQESVLDMLDAAANNLEDCAPLVPDFKKDKNIQDAVRRCARRLSQILRDFPDAKSELE